MITLTNIENYPPPAGEVRPDNGKKFVSQFFVDPY
jgi:hypothetical protein